MVALFVVALTLFICVVALFDLQNYNRYPKAIPQSEAMASVSDQFLYGQSDEYVDFDQFLDFSPTNDDEYSVSNSISPDTALPYDADVLCNDLPDFSQTAFPDLASYDMSQEPYSAHQSADMGWIPEPTPVFDEAMFQGYQPYGGSQDFRQMVEAQAAADPRMASAKEKRREAAIALHLQRLCDATALELDMSSDSSTSFSSPNLSDSMCESFSPQPASASLGSTPVPAPIHAHGGMELVLDLNMNATANLPKKQKPRSQAQKESYIKARKYGACEKHKKQHKRVSLTYSMVLLGQVLTLHSATAWKRPLSAPAQTRYRRTWLSRRDRSSQPFRCQLSRIQAHREYRDKSHRSDHQHSSRRQR